MPEIDCPSNLWNKYILSIRVLLKSRFLHSWHRWRRIRTLPGLNIQIYSTNPTYYRLYMNTMKISISQKFYSAFYLWFYTLQVGPRGRTSRSPLIISFPAIYFASPSTRTRLQAHYRQSVAGCNSRRTDAIFSPLFVKPSAIRPCPWWMYHRL
jgi:hypothetical protein